MTEQSYWERLESRSPQSYEPAHKLIEYIKKDEQYAFEPKEGSLVVYLVLPYSGQRISLFFIRTDGVIECWPDTIGSQLVKAGLDRDLVKPYDKDLERVLGRRTKRLSILSPVQSIQIDDFLQAVDKFVQAVLAAEPVATT